MNTCKSCEGLRKEIDRLIEESLRFYHADSSYETLSKPSEVLKRRREAAIELNQLCTRVTKLEQELADSKQENIDRADCEKSLTEWNQSLTDEIAKMKPVVKAAITEESVNHGHDDDSPECGCTLCKRVREYNAIQQEEKTDE